MNFDPRYYLAVVMRRLHYLVLTFAAITAVAAVVAFRMQPVYESQARLLMESPRIPDSLAAPTVATAALEQLQIVEQRLMTRTNLLAIARQFDALPGIATMTPDEIVEAMRRASKIDKQAGRDQATLMTVSFRAPTAKAAADVVNEYVTRILTDNTATRTGQAQDTLQFFTQEVERLSTNLSTQSTAILEFQNKNADALPDTLDYRLTQQSNLQERLAGVERDLASLRDQRARLVEIYRSTGQLGATQITPEAAQLAQLQTDLARARAIYSATNPKVTLLESTIAELQAKIDTQAPPDANGQVVMTPLDIQTTQIDAQLAQLELQARDITTELAKLKESIDRTAAVAVQLQALQRDYDNTQVQYATATDRLSKASTGERIEALAKGQRIGVLDAATVPDAPYSPNRVKIMALGGVAGIVLGFGLILLTELMNSAIRRPTDLERHLQIIPIGVIPYISTPREIARRRWVIAAVLVVGVVGLPLAVWAVDRFYLPIDLIVDKIIKKLNL
ncbi:lipopolysaccharide biosynthesis [Rhodobacter sp. KR11]|uniref:GumC family protein n=1 Tax=Rhodobacter sp. KR11 TaxID=2974588 RepID=UPI002222E153|nr:lipopolysaccharide biosynthesis [Rhodobacter sp. KR11]MCW1920771.1 lipopolysaccharide biosynthesis [Rhodobacter sp. KR11]